MRLQGFDMKSITAGGPLVKQELNHHRIKQPLGNRKLQHYTIPHLSHVLPPPPLSTSIIHFGYLALILGTGLIPAEILLYMKELIKQRDVSFFNRNHARQMQIFIINTENKFCYNFQSLKKICIMVKSINKKMILLKTCRPSGQIQCIKCS